MKPEFIWTTSGDWIATKVGDNIFDATKTWVAWLDGSEVYTKDGEWIGTMSRDNRILRARAASRKPLRNDVPAAPPKPDLPARAPLPPTFSELSFSTIDVLEEEPEVLKRLSDRRKDMGD